MCGIIGYIGKNVEENLFEGLKRLEYRGYDSAGMTVMRNGNFDTYKSVGEVDNLKAKLKFNEEFGFGIAHTRWATHGKITIENCHPHFSSNGNIAIVHNGIIDNFEDLKIQLQAKDKCFVSQTDSEVVAKLLDKLNINNLRRVLKQIKGSYALVLLSKEKDCLYFAKNKSPLYVGKGDDCVMVASDPSCFAGKIDRYYQLKDGEYGKISLKSLVFYDKNDEIIEKTQESLDFNFISEGKSGYDHFMIKEIYQSRIALENIIAKFQTAELEGKLKELKKLMFDRIYLVGCGTAYHAGLIGQSYIRAECNIDTFCEVASEFKEKNFVIDENSLCIFISQSGETADTLSALEYCKQKNAHIIAITNTEYSTIAKKADINFPTCAGQEKAVASTKAYFAQCVMLYLIISYLKGKNNVEKLKLFKNQIDFGDDKALKNLAEIVSKYDKIFFIGRGVDYITAEEASLKLKEITYIFSSALPSGELKHGTLALVDESVLVIVIATDEKLFNKTLNNAYEIKSRGGKLVLFTQLNVDREVAKNFEMVFKVGLTQQDFYPMQIILPLQKLAYFTAVKKGINPDKPRNLAKSVTVE